jgi:hypothetical protein
LVESKLFLSEDSSLIPLKTHIAAELRQESPLQGGISFSNGGFFLGRWFCDPRTSEFSYFARSADRTDLYSIRGQFVIGKGDQWVARIIEASRTGLFNLFGKRAYDLIKPGMTLNEVTTLLGIHPGAYYAGEVTFDVDVGNKYTPFSGSAKHCSDTYPALFSVNKESRKKGWISNEIVIYVTLDERGKVTEKESYPVRERQETHPALTEAVNRMFQRLKMDRDWKQGRGKASESPPGKK